MPHHPFFRGSVFLLRRVWLWSLIKYFDFHLYPKLEMIQFDLRIFFRWVGKNHQHSFHSKVISGGGGTALRSSFHSPPGFANAAGLNPAYMGGEIPSGMVWMRTCTNLRGFVQLCFCLLVKVIPHLQFQ